MRNAAVSIAFLFYGISVSGQAFFADVQSQIINQEIRYGDISTFHGPGISFADYDNDGWDDISIPASSTRDFQFLRNTGGGFEIEDLPISSNGLEAQQITWVDFDNDGDLDFFATSNLGQCWFYRSDGNGVYTDILLASGLAQQSWKYSGVAWGDYDNDGYLDAFLMVRDTDTNHHNLLYRNNGNGTFTDLTNVAGLPLERKLTLAAAFLDYDRDGYQDIFVANDKETIANQLYRNAGDGTFQDVSFTSDMDLLMDGMSATIGDYDQDGWTDIYITNGYYPDNPESVVGNAFMKNNADGTFTNVALQNGTRFDSFAWGAVFLDAENDGDLDLYVSGERDGSNGRLPSAFYQNDGSGNYNIPVNSGFVDNTFVSFGNAWGDIQNDGLPDIVVVNTEDQSLNIWENQSSTDNNWIKIKLQGTESNRMGIGSFLKIGFGNEVVYRYTNCGEGFISQNSLSQIVGIGDATSVDFIEVLWLSGITDRFENIEPNQTLSLIEGTNPIDNNEGIIRAKTRTEQFAHLSVARQWNEALLDAIRTDFARPTVHARNLYHSALAMFDSWAVFDETAETVFLGKTRQGFSCEFEGIDIPDNYDSARAEIMSFALYRLFISRFEASPGRTFAYQRFGALMNSLGYNPSLVSTNYGNGSYAALGNYLGAKLIEFGFNDGANEQDGYSNEYYQPVNEPLSLGLYEESYELADPNRWQPLAFETFIDQSGNTIAGGVPGFLNPEWGEVKPFALQEVDLEIRNNGFDSYLYNDPGAPPEIQNSMQDGINDPYKWHFALVASWSSHLDPADPTVIDISPGSIGNVDFTSYPSTFEEYQSFYNFMEGGDIGSGHLLNPATGQPYEQQIVKRADYARVLAEFWADGPDSETPPGHWFSIVNYVSDHPETSKQIAGVGEEVNELEWDVKAYLALGGAMHDAAVNTWGVKGYYDYIRPISAIRYMASKGQSSDNNLPNFHPHGLPLIPGRIELIESGDPLSGLANENVGKIKIYAWKGPDFIADPTLEVAGVDWILGTHWWPYQRPTFVTPPFAGYVSGHSTFSRAAAEVLTRLTGNAYFPGGMGIFDIEQNNFLVFEAGPSENITLQWATYRDASEQTSLSRIWGGIHPPIDDIPGRIIGDKIGNEAVDLAMDYFQGHVELPANNFQFKITGESCFKQSDGSITVNAIDFYDYVLEMNGLEYNFNREIVLDELKPGVHSFCLRVKGKSETELCYDVNIEQAVKIKASTNIESIGLENWLTIEVEKGTPPFVLKINDEVIGSFTENTIKTRISEGDQLKLTSSLSCEGEFIKSISLSEQMTAFPNPTSDILNIPGITEQSVIEFYNSTWQLVRTFTGKEAISLTSLSPGVYFAVIREGNSSTSIKVIVTD